MKNFLYVLAGFITVSIIGSFVVFGPNIYEYFGKQYADADREIFKNTVTYNDGVLDDLAKYNFEYEMAEDDVERAAIADLVRNQFANFDKSKIENDDLKEFLEDCGL